MNDVKIIDNFLTESEFKFISDQVLHNKWFSWFLTHGVANSDIRESNKNHYYFAHIFYNEYSTNSDYFKMVLPIIKKLDVKALIRCKANLYYKTKDRIEHDPHTDYDYSHKGALLNLTTNNGCTVIDGKMYKSIENQMIIFDTSKSHNSTTCTDNELRVNIVTNYF